MDIGSFINMYLPYAQSVNQQTGLPVDFVLGQAAIETGWGTSPASQNNNFFGISPGGNLASYPNVGAGFNAYSDLINSSRYSGWTGISNPNAYNIASYLNNQGYSTTPTDTYANSVSQAAGQISDYLGASNTNSSFGTNNSNTGGFWNSPTGVSDWFKSTPFGQTMAQDFAPGNSVNDPLGNAIAQTLSGQKSSWTTTIGGWLERVAIIVIGIVVVAFALRSLTNGRSNIVVETSKKVVKTGANFVGASA